MRSLVENEGTYRSSSLQLADALALFAVKTMEIESVVKPLITKAAMAAQAPAEKSPESHLERFPNHHEPRICYARGACVG